MELEQVQVRSPKRKLDETVDLLPLKRQRQTYQRHHVLHYPPQSLPSKDAVPLEPEQADKLLVDAIKMICEEEGVMQNIYNPVIESLALEALRSSTDEFILRLCSFVRRSMQSARRTTPIATDFESAISVLDIPRPDSQLKPYQTQPEINPPLLPTPPPEDIFHEERLPSTFLGPELNAQALKRFSLTTASLPPLPSTHTYKDTAVFPKRETDSRKIRELATEEGKLGEQALRKLAGAIKLDAAHPVDVETKKQAESVQLINKRKRKPRVSEAALFDETMRDLLKDELGGFELGPLVTSEKAYRMPDDGQRRTVTSSKGKEVAGDGALEPVRSGSSSKSGPHMPPAAEGAEVMEL